MDGNGRWARKRKLPRIMGHRSGAKAVDRVTEKCARLGIKALTLYAFSAENWKRPKEEVDALMDLLRQNLKKNIERLRKNNIRFNVIGRISSLSDPLKREIKDTIERTRDNTGMVLTLALNYGGRQEILDAVKAVCQNTHEESLDVSSWEDADFGKYLYTGDLPDPDLIIRTSGEMRLSNFLLWQAAYAEFYFTDTLWPDFGAAEMEKALKEYERRERRFGE
ncbi:MAG: isoprenyl transferase [Candidatus Omnitrophota bacterium]|nr:isoprenyl transferase [Candidatus Omnitrophota bacterium]